MSDSSKELLIAFELHSVERIRDSIDSGIDVRSPLRGKLPINWLIEMYTRSSRFPDCLRLLLERGAVFDDPLIAPVLLDDPESLAAAIRETPPLLEHRTTITSPFTPLVDASLLHVAAEYGNAQATRVLIDMGADVEARADVDDFGLNGHTAIFHTVNSHANRSEPVLKLLIEAGARCDLRLPGITWGKGYDWETTCFDVTPLSYAQLGLLPQMHRSEHDVYATVRLLLEAAGRAIPPLENIPNKYLQTGDG